MSYIDHLIHFYRHVQNDDRLAARHISLYYMLFNEWLTTDNYAGFTVYRDKLMKYSGITRKQTYANTIRELHQYGYIIYHHNAGKRMNSRVTLIAFGVTEENAPNTDNKNATMGVENDTGSSNKDATLPVTTGVENGTGSSNKDATPSTAMSVKNDTHTVSKTVLNKNIYKDNKYNLLPYHFTPPTIEEVFKLAAEKNYDQQRAHHFFLYYKSRGWLMGDHPIRDWEAALEKWFLRGSGPNDKFKPNEQKKIFNPL